MTGDRIRTFTHAAWRFSLPPFPAYFPIASPDQCATPSKPVTTPQQQRARLDPALWMAIAERARHASLPDLAYQYGVSHATIRAIVRRVGRVAAAA